MGLRSRTPVSQRITETVCRVKAQGTKTKNTLDVSFAALNLRREQQDVEKQMLLHAQRETDRITRAKENVSRKETKETKKKTTKKRDTSKNRYNKTNNRTKNTRSEQWVVTEQEVPADQMNHTVDDEITFNHNVRRGTVLDPLDTYVQQVKDKVRSLNPIHRARNDLKVWSALFRVLRSVLCFECNDIS